MTKEEIIEMAFKAGVEDSNEYNHLVCTEVELVAFAKLVAKKEREACAECGVNGNHALYCVACAEKYLKEKNT